MYCVCYAANITEYSNLNTVMVNSHERGFNVNEQILYIITILTVIVTTRRYSLRTDCVESVASVIKYQKTFISLQFGMFVLLMRPSILCSVITIIQKGCIYMTIMLKCTHSI